MRCAAAFVFASLAVLALAAVPTALAFYVDDDYDALDYENEYFESTAPVAYAPPPSDVEGNIVNGEKVGYGYAYTVALARDSPTNVFCAGVLFARDIVLTAAQCMAGRPISNMYVVTELYNTADPINTATQVYTITQVIVHPEYGTDLLGRAND
eukprot:scaffold326431_cov35-Prasinocladus_malaysianus.AAC.1